MKTNKQNTVGKCGCKRGIERDNCPQCEGTGFRINFAALRAAKTEAKPEGAAKTEAKPEGVAGAYRTPDGKAQIEWELEHKENGLEFSASGQFAGSCGQCLDEIAAAYPADVMVQRICKVWADYHLNGMNAGTPEQRAELARMEKQTGIVPDYDLQVQWLKAAGLYEVKLPAGTTATGGFPPEVEIGARGYRYGERWIYQPLPAAVVEEISSWKAPAAAESLGEFQAKSFLAEHGLRLRITLSDTKPAAWNLAGHHYRVTLTREAVSGARLVFDFWGSWADMEAGKTPTAHDVLACISADIHTPETFADFCAEFGDDTDSIKAKQTFRRADRFARRLRAFFTAPEIAALEEIN